MVSYTNQGSKEEQLKYNNMDVLLEIKNRKISVSEAHNIIDKAISDSNEGKYPEFEYDGRVDLAAIIGMNEYEYTAYGHGADLETIANWRYDGWPTYCCKTGKPINYKNYGWFVTKCEDGKLGLKIL